MRVPTTTSTGPVACRPRTARKRSSGPKHSHKNWTYCRGPVTVKSITGGNPKSDGVSNPIA